jgi:hypothetical protein
MSIHQNCISRVVISVTNTGRTKQAGGIVHLVDIEKPSYGVDLRDFGRVNSLDEQS